MRLRGQTSAPVELVVAIIVMAMSMGMALMIMGNTSTAQCEDQIKAGMRSLSSAMLDVSLGSPPTSREIKLQLGTCGSYNVEAIRFVRYSRATFCADCPSASGGCWKIIPVSYDKKLQEYTPIRNAITCVDLPQAIQLKQTNTCATPDTAALELSKTACPPEAVTQDGYCNEKKYGSEYNTEQNNAAAWLTMGKTKSEINYAVILSKDMPTGDEQAISVCVRPKK